jgi:hypothetical protein
VTATAGQPETSSRLAKSLGIVDGLTVQELGFYDDCDDQVRAEIELAAGSELVDENFDNVVDVVLLWWRDGDGDLIDALVDAVAPLTGEGVIWLLTPKHGRDGYVEPVDISDAAPIAGLQRTSTLSAGKDWHGTRLVAKRAKRSGKKI